MKGFAVEVLAMVILAVLVILVMYTWFAGQTAVQPAWQPYTTASGPACRSNADCATSPDGTLCVSLSGSSLVCACLDDADCLEGRRCVDMRCG